MPDKALLAAGADVNAKNEYDCTALILAAENGHFEVIELLKKAANQAVTG